MAFTTIIEAQSAAVLKAVERNNLEIQSSFYTDFNDDGKVIRNQLKAQIRTVQKDLDAANTFLNANHTAPLYYSTFIFDQEQRVSTPWSNEKDIPGTVKAYISTLPSGSVPDFEAIQGSNNLLLSQLAKTIAEKRKIVVNQSQISNSILPQKTILIKDSLLDLDQSEALAAEIEAHNASIQKTINTIKTPDSNVPALNSNDTQIRDTIQHTTEQKVGYEGQLDVESKVILRKRVLDAFYSAKTPEEKALAQKRLDYTLEAASTSVPITHITIPYDPERYFKLSTELSELQDQALDLQIQIDNTTDPTQLAILNQLLAQKNKQSLIISDMLAGFQDSKIPSTNYFGSDDVNQLSLPPNNSGVNYSNQPNPNETNEIKNQRNMADNSPANNMSIDLATNQPIPNDQVQYSASGRYTQAADPATTANIDALVQQQLNTANATESNIRIKNDFNKLGTTSTYQINNVILDEKLKEQNDNLEKLKDEPEKKAQIDKNIADLNSQKVALSNTYNSDVKAYNDSNQKAALDLSNQTSAINAESKTLKNYPAIPITTTNATTVVNNFDTSVAAQDRSQIELSKQLSIVEENTRTNNPGADPKLSANWSDADKKAVQAKIDATNVAAANQKTAANDLLAFNATPGGQDAIAKAGVNPIELQKKLQGNGSNSAQSIALQNNNITGNVKDAKFGSQAVFDKLEPSNIRPINGFEGINNGAPFYLQMPTLSTLAHFKLPNGISPYGRRAPTEVARDAVHFNIFEINPPAPKATSQPNGLVVNSVDSAKSNTLGVFTVYPTNSDYLHFNHQHTFNDETGSVSLINQALGLVDTVDSLTALGATAADSLSKGREQGVNSRVQRRMEAISTYSGTDKQSLTIDFVLFTKNNFLLDVFKPLMFLTSLSYPKRTLNGNFGATSEKVGNTLKSTAANNPQVNETIRKLLTASANGIQDAGQFLEKVENELSRYGGIGPYRYYISRRPEYMSIRHASGLFTFPLAYISNVSYDFQGPWYNYDHQPVAYAGDIEKLLQAGVQQAAASKGFLDSITDAFKNAFNAPSNKSQTNNPQTTFVNPTNPHSLAGNIRTYESDAAYIQANKLPYAYPSWAKVSVTVHNALPMFRDDFLQSFYSTTQEGLVTISQNESGFDKSLNLANGVAKQNAFQ